MSGSGPTGPIASGKMTAEMRQNWRGVGGWGRGWRFCDGLRDWGLGVWGVWVGLELGLGLGWSWGLGWVSEPKESSPAGGMAEWEWSRGSEGGE